MKTIAASIHNFLFSPMDSFPLSFFRIAVGLFGLLQFLLLSANWLQLYGVNGYVEWFISYELFSIKELPSIVSLANFLLPLGISDNAIVAFVTGIYVLSLMGVTVGWRTKPMIFMAWLTHFMLCNTAMAFGYGVETFMHVSLFYLLFAPCSQYLSLDALAHRVSDDKINSQARFMVRIMQLHLCVVYFNAGFAKMLGVDWWQGEAVWYIFGNTNYSQFNLQFLADLPFIPKTLSWWTLVIETAFPIFMYLKRSRKFWIVNIVMLHVGIGLIMGLYMFGLIMIILNVAAFTWMIFPKQWAHFQQWACEKSPLARRFQIT